MPRGSRHDLSGIILHDEWRTVLRVQDGGDWHRDSNRNFSAYLGRGVHLQGNPLPSVHRRLSTAIRC